MWRVDPLYALRIEQELCVRMSRALLTHMLVGLRVIIACSILLLNAPQGLAKELGVVEDLFIGRHAISPPGGFGRYQNLLVRSEELDHASWVKSASTTVPATNLTAPDGSTTAESITFGGAGLDTIQQASTTAAGSTQFTGSVWLKVASGTLTVRIGVIDQAGSPAGTYANADLDTTWQRFQVTHTFAGGTGNAVLILDDNTNASSQTIHAWGAQLESGTGTAGVYTKTSAGTVTASRGLVSNTDAVIGSNETIGGTLGVTGATTLSSTLG